VFGVLRERYNLSDKLNIPRENLRNIESIAAGLREFLQDGAGRPAVAATQASHPPTAAAAVVAASPTPVAEDLARSVCDIFADVTRYPIDILDPAASLEEDLGIDSVKVGEVFAVLRERYNLPEDMQIPRESLKTIGAVTDALRKFVASKPVPVVSVSAHEVSSKPRILEDSFDSLTPERRPFEGKITLVTGSGHGLGRDIAKYLAGLGATVIVNSFHSRDQGVRTTEEIQAEGGKAYHIWGSVANPQHVEAIFKEIDRQFGGLDFFISNASNGMLARLEDVTVEHWEKAFRTNVVGLHQCSLRALDLMKHRGGGKIITLSSPAATGYVDYFACMAAVKMAVESLTKSMAVEFAKYNVQVNCVSPGPIYGDLLNKWPEAERLIPEWERATVCGRLCMDRDVSHFIAYLLSDAVKLFTGSVLVLDGGMSVWFGGVSQVAPGVGTAATDRMPDPIYRGAAA